MPIEHPPRRRLLDVLRVIGWACAWVAFPAGSATGFPLQPEPGGVAAKAPSATASKVAPKQAVVGEDDAPGERNELSDLSLEELMDVQVVVSASRAYYFTSQPTGEPEWTETRMALRRMGFEPWLHQRVSGRSKAVDLDLATEALMLAGEHRTQVSVLFSGDGDFVPVVEAMKRLGQHVVVGGIRETCRPDLLIAGDDLVDLTRT